MTVLCEDKQQYDFIKAYVKLLGATKINRLPAAYNNATVLEHYPSAVISHRSRSTFQNIILVAMIDADEKTVQERLKEFDEKLDIEKARLNQPTRSNNEKVLLFAPIRNIESWFHYIQTNADDVETKTDNSGKVISYKNQYKNPDIGAFAKKLKEDICLNGWPENAPSSLHHACTELNRLKN